MAASAAPSVAAAGYVRVSTAKQEDGYSPEIQREAIRAFAAQRGYTLVLEESDVKKGRVVTREGYQRILDGVRAGIVHTVIVYMFDRWGRDGGEWVVRARELERAGVDFLSVQEGKEEAGLMRFVRAGMSEEYSRQLAKRVRPAKERSVRGGQHIGITPYGYLRKYPERIGGVDGGRYQPGLLVKDDATAWVVQELFRRYAAGGWTLRTLASWLNSDPACPRSPKGKDWTICNVQYILRNPVYTGRIRYNHARLGFYDTSAPGSEFVTEGRHEALIDPNLFATVQERLDTANRHQVRTRLHRPVPLGGGLLVCAECGGPMAAKRRRDETAKQPQYSCRHGHEGVNGCRGRSYVMDFAHAALLAQVKRLQGRPWQVDRLEAVIDADDAVDARADLQRALSSANEELKRHIRRFNALIEDPTPQEVAAHRAIGREISERIAALEAQLAALPAPAVSVPDLKTLHEELTRTDLATLIDELAAQGDEEALRDLVLPLVASAKVVERVPEVKSKWLRAEVTWTDDVRMLLDAGLLALGPDVERPDYPGTLQELRRQKYLRYAARKKAGLVGVVPPARNGVVVR